MNYPKELLKKYPKSLLDFVSTKSIATGICVLDDYKNGKISVKVLLEIYKNHP